MKTSGLTGTFRTWARGDGSYRLEQKVGPASRVVVYDGQRGWVQDGSAWLRPWARAELAQVVSDAYLETSSALVEGRLRGTVRARPEGTLVVAPERGEPMTVELDASCRPRTIARRQADRTLTTRVESWTTVDGLALPAVVVQSTGDERYESRFEYQVTLSGAAAPAASFGPPEPRLRPEMPAGRDVVDVPMELGGNHVFVPVSVNGKAPSWFVLDTGAEVSVMDAGHAAELGLTAAGAIEARGMGEASMDAAVIAAPSLVFGGVRVPLDSIYTVPLRPLWPRAGRAMHGILGYDVLGHFAVELDYAARVVRLHDPDRYAAPPSSTALPVTFESNMPAVGGEVELPGGRRLPARITVDSGAGSALTLSSPFLARHGVREAVGPVLSGSTGRGIAGATQQDMGRIVALHLGPYELREPVTAFSLDQKGASANPDVDANLGGEVLRRFTVVFDYPRSRMVLTPNAALREAFEADASGLQLMTDDALARVVVEKVVPGTPAAEAGVQAGDEIASVDGRPLRGGDLQDLRKRLRDPGRTFSIELRRGGEVVRTKLTTRRLV